ncbi:hypothetical protein CFP56_001918 [Quercus suber]|uniref:Uncharacterized protein n=1 Tax=Quercus suber TaxID=58331 RepID=A0AAW0LEU7_QUESU
MSGQVGPTTGPRRNSVTQKQRGPSTVKRSSSSDNYGNGHASKPSSPPLPQSSCCWRGKDGEEAEIVESTHDS